MTTETTTRDVPVFKNGQIVHLNLLVEDESGVVLLEARFRNEDNSSADFYQRVELSGGTTETAVIEFRVDEMAPGHYVCEYVALTDAEGNKSLHAVPGIEFHVEGDAESHKGPALRDWSFA
jgi:hypothetical protein